MRTFIDISELHVLIIDISWRSRNVLRRDGGKDGVPSDNMPVTPFFNHNATAVYSLEVRNALSAFRTELALFANVRGQASLSTLQRYPFDE
jgi:hypothetical protein